MKYDICYFAKANDAVGIKVGQYIATRPAKSRWTPAERKLPFGIWRDADLSDAELEHLKTGKKRVSQHGGRGTAPSLVNVPSSEWPVVDAPASVEADHVAVKKPKSAPKAAAKATPTTAKKTPAKRTKAKV